MQRVLLFEVYVDVTKSIDPVNRDAHWNILWKIETSEIPVDNDVKQRDVMTPTLFSVFFCVMLIHAFRHCKRGHLFWVLEFRNAGKFSDFRRFNFKSKTFHTLIREFFFSDEVDFLDDIVDNMQHTLDLFSASGSEFDFKIRFKKKK